MGETKHEARAIFTAALAFNTPADRERYLEQSCAGKPALRQRIEALLRAHEQASHFLEINGGGEGPVMEVPGAMVGRYKLLEQIGEGGFGIVFLAEQVEPIRRRVAVKIVKPGMDTKQVVARFEAERQALALMAHPNIAKVFDAGATESGRPYFVMELVQGLPLTRFCDANDLNPTERLKLFATICEAVQHAHQKGIIHRDLKPSNILVTLRDGKPVPKVIDFGTAKALQQPLTQKTLFTACGKLIGTPQYMSPEQAEMSPDASGDVDTRADIYSLGVLLYELLTGTTPFEAERLRTAAFEEMMHIIREEEPPKPSTRVSTLGARATEVAKHRQVDAALLRRTLKGDLDWIVMKALEKDRTRRYETANALAMDVQRHLSQEPVQASPPSKRYRFSKLVRRNKRVCAAGATVAVALVFGLGVSLWMFGRERTAKREQIRLHQLAETNFQTARTAVDRLLALMAAELAGQPRMEKFRRQLLEDALEYYQGFLKQKGSDPELQHALAQTHMRVGEIYKTLARNEQALEAWTQALTLLEPLALRHPGVAQYREEMAVAHEGLAWASVWLERNSESIVHRRKQLALSEELARDFPAEPAYFRMVAYARVGLGNTLGQCGRSKEALEELQQALTWFEQSPLRSPNLPEHRDLEAHVQLWLGAALEQMDRFEAAERAFRRSYELRREQVAAQPDLLRLRVELARVAACLGRLSARIGKAPEAEECLRQAVAIGTRLVEESPDDADLARCVGDDHRSLGEFLMNLGRLSEAEGPLRRSVEINAKAAANLPRETQNRPSLAWDYYVLGLLLQSTGRTQESAGALQQAIEIFDRLIAEGYPSPTNQRNLGWMLITCPAAHLQDPPRAVSLAKQAVQQEPDKRLNWQLLGIAQYRAGNPAGAIEALEKMTELLDRGDVQARLFLAMAHWQTGHQQLARDRYNEAVAWIGKHNAVTEETHRIRAEAEALLHITAPQ